MFVPFPKIPRLISNCTITEKIDGTNAQVYIVHKDDPDSPINTNTYVSVGDYCVMAGSRKRMINPDSDNFGFARWVWDNAERLMNLGPGRHFGEWWGAGIQRRYGLDHKRFSLFNVNRWGVDSRMSQETLDETGCYVVPVLYYGLFNTEHAKEVLANLLHTGSEAAPDFMNPEGIMIYHDRGNCMFKMPYDPAPKGQ